MDRFNFKRHVLPHIVAILVFLLVTVAYFKPVFFENKSLSQHDILQWRGGAQELLDYREEYGEEALWTNSMFSGMPAYLITTQWGFGAPALLQNVLSLGLPHPVKIVFLSFLGFYILLLSFKVRPYLAIAGALAFGLSSYNIIGLGAGHNSRITAIAYMPLVLAGIHLSFTQSRLLGLAVTALALTLHLNANHLQITYYLALIVLSYLLVQGISAYRSKALTDYIKTGSVLLFAALIALGTFIGIFSSTLEYSAYSIRGTSEIAPETAADSKGLSKDYAFQYSNGIFEPMTLLIPNILGGSMQTELSNDSNVAKTLRKQGYPETQISQSLAAMPTYWGNQSNTAPYYAGAIAVFLFVLALMVVDRKTLAWTIPMIVLGIMLSWGSSFSSFNYFMFDYFPGYNKFRSVTFALIISILLINLLGFIGLEMLFKNKLGSDSIKKLMVASSITGGLVLLLAVVAGVFSYSGAVDSQLPEWLINPLAADRKWLLQADALRAFAFILVATGVIYATLKGKISTIAMPAIVILLVLIDMWTIDKRFLDESKFSRNPQRAYFNPTEADNIIAQDKAISYRVFNLINPFNEARTSYHHHSIGGYHGAKLRRYQDLIDAGISAEHQQIINSLQTSGSLPSEMNIINMLNTKYLVAGPSGNAVIPNYEAYGNAWLVNKIIAVNSPAEELSATVSNSDKGAAVVDQTKFTFGKQEYAGQGTVVLKKYEPNELQYEADLTDDGLIVFSEIYYPKGWIATIDGKTADLLRANYVLRALEVPKGKHEITLKFQPAVYSYGNLIATVSSILLILLIVGTLLIESGFSKQLIKRAA